MNAIPPKSHLLPKTSSDTYNRWLPDLTRLSSKNPDVTTTRPFMGKLTAATQINSGCVGLAAIVVFYLILRNSAL